MMYCKEIALLLTFSVLVPLPILLWPTFQLTSCYFFIFYFLIIFAGFCIDIELQGAR